MVVTKIDMCPANVLQDTVKLLVRILKSPGCRKIPVFVQCSDDVITSAANFTSERSVCGHVGRRGARRGEAGEGSVCTCYVCVHVCMRAHVYVCARASACVRAHTHCVCVCVCVRVRVRVCVDASMCL